MGGVLRSAVWACDIRKFVVLRISAPKEGFRRSPLSEVGRMCSHRDVQLFKLFLSCRVLLPAHAPLSRKVPRVRRTRVQPKRALRFRGSHTQGPSFFWSGKDRSEAAAAR